MHSEHSIKPAGTEDAMQVENDAWLVPFPLAGWRWQRSLRWERVRTDRRVLVAGLVVAVLVTLLEWVGFGLGMRRHDFDTNDRGAVQVELIAPSSPPLPIPPEPEPPEFQHHAHKVTVAPPTIRITPPPPTVGSESREMQARIGSAGQPPPVQLFNPDGSVKLPKTAPHALGPANPRDAGKARWAEIEKRGENPLDCRRTRFAKAYAADQSIGDKVAGKYLKWIGLADAEAIKHSADQREQRAEEGCDPAH